MLVSLLEPSVVLPRMVLLCSSLLGDTRSASKLTDDQVLSSVRPK
jgi:hypothetical protein